MYDLEKDLLKNHCKMTEFKGGQKRVDSHKSLKNRSYNTLYTVGCLGQGQFAFINWGGWL